MNLSRKEEEINDTKVTVLQEGVNVWFRGQKKTGLNGDVEK